MSRVLQQGDLRPMSGHTRAMDDLVAILKSREPHYAKADARSRPRGRPRPRRCAS